MNSTVLYLIKTTSVLALLYLLYIVFLDKLTFHKANRCVLVVMLPVSLLLPLSHYLFPVVPIFNEMPLFQEVNINAFAANLHGTKAPLKGATFKYSAIAVSIYWMICSVFCFRFLMAIRQLFVLKKQSKIKQKKGHLLIIAKVPEIFSAFNWIFIPEDIYPQYDEQIIAHEKVHVSLKHSWDVILIEIYSVFFWFNPILYFYRKSLKVVHEYQADRGVLQSGVKPSQYMALLMQSLTISKRNTLYNYFSQPILKKRVTMMTKPKSNPLSTLKYLLILPVCLFLISAFKTPLITTHTNLNTTSAATILNSPPTLFPLQNGTKDNIRTHFGIINKHSKHKGNMHKGVDIIGQIGTPILATADGIVRKAALEGNWGNLIIITHQGGFETWYAHLKGFHTHINKAVKKGTIIGYLGNTGKVTVPHLHYEIKHNGKHLNPIDYLE